MTSNVWSQMCGSAITEMSIKVEKRLRHATKQLHIVHGFQFIGGGVVAVAFVTYGAYRIDAFFFITCRCNMDGYMRHPFLTPQI